MDYGNEVSRMNLHHRVPLHIAHDTALGQEVDVLNVSDMTLAMLDEWRGAWSPQADLKDNRLALETQAALLTRIKAFSGGLRGWSTSHGIPRWCSKPSPRKKARRGP